MPEKMIPCEVSPDSPWGSLRLPPQNFRSKLRESGPKEGSGIAKGLDIGRKFGWLNGTPIKLLPVIKCLHVALDLYRYDR